MGVTSICTNIGSRLQMLPGVDQVTISPPAQLPDDRMIIITPDPGGGKPYAHASELGKRVVAYHDTIVIEAHWKIAQDQIGAALEWALPLLDLVRNEIWLGFQFDAFGHTVTEIDSVETQRFGGLGWGADPTFGFILTVPLMHAEEVI